MAKRVIAPPEKMGLRNVADVFSVSGCISDDFADYVPYWKHNGYWLFDSPEIIRAVANAASISLEGTQLFYYEVYPLQFDGEQWVAFAPEPSFQLNVQAPSAMQLEGFDVVTFWAGTSPECSPLSCNLMAKEVETNSHCLLVTLEQAKQGLESGVFKDAEPGPYRIFSVNSVPWPREQ